MADKLLTRKSKRGVADLCAVALIGCICSGLYYILHSMQHINHDNPFMSMIFPVIGTVTIALLLPLFIFLSYPEDFKPWNPIIPAHYIKVCRKAYGAMARNNWKVSEKDL